MMSDQAIRFGLRHSPELRSSSWKVSVGKDSSVYVINRPIGGSVKVSLHPGSEEQPGREWRIALTDEYMKSGDIDRESRVIDSWDSEAMRLKPGMQLKLGFAVVLGRFSLAYHPTSENPDAAKREEKELRVVDWITDVPDQGTAWQVTVLVTDPNTRSTPPGPGSRAMGSVPVGRLDLPNKGEVWVMRHRIPVTDEMMKTINMGMSFAFSQLPNGPGDGVHRILLRGKEDDGLRWWIETAATKGAPAGTLEIDE